MKVKIKRLSSDAVVPKYAKDGDAGLDLVATSRKLFTGDDKDADYIEYGTGLAIEIPKGYVGLIFPRSSNSKKDLSLCNSVGVVDSGYRGEITFRYKVDATYEDIFLSERDKEVAIIDDTFAQAIYKEGDRVGQLIILPYPQIEFEEVDDLSNSERGAAGYGSSGK